MNSRERVMRAIEFEYPDRIPICLEGYEISDVYFIAYSESIEWIKEDKNSKYLKKILASTDYDWVPGALTEDEWGCVWQNSTTVPNLGIVKGHPLQDLDKLKTYKFPDPKLKNRFDSISEQIKKGGDKYILISSYYTLFERMYFLHGFTEVLEDLYLRPREMGYIADEIVNFQLGIADSLKPYKGKINGVFLCDDWGTEISTFISTEMWKKFFKPRYEKIFNAFKNQGLHIWFHSDGKINPFIKEFISIGLDVMNLTSPHILGIKEISKEYKGQICLATSADLQKTYATGTISELLNEIKLLISEWGDKRGGLICLDDTDYSATGSTKERLMTIVDAYIKYGSYYQI